MTAAERSSGLHVAAEVVDDLATRFRHARRAALRSVLEESSSSEFEEQLLIRAKNSGADYLRAVFDNALALGLGFARHFGQVSLQELPRLLPELGVECYEGLFERTEDPRALGLVRPGCSMVGPACEHYREALAGLLLGLSGSVLLSRTESVCSGGSRCRDVLHEDIESPSQWAPIPTAWAPALVGVQKLARTLDARIALQFMGLKESVLHYRLTSAAGDGAMSPRSMIEQSLHRRLPGVELREVTARAVLASESMST